jgi:hypothetical protein
MREVTNRFIDFHFWIIVILLSGVSFLCGFSFLTTISFDNKVSDSYQKSPYNVCLVASYDEKSENEFIYFNGQLTVYRSVNNGTYSNSIANSNLFMQKDTLNKFTLKRVLSGPAKLGLREIGLSSNLLKTYRLAIGDNLLIPSLSLSNYKITSVYEDSFGIFSLDYHSDYGFMIVGYDETFLKEEYSYAAFLEEYHNDQFGPMVYFKKEYLQKVQSEEKNFLIKYLSILSAVIIVFPFILDYKHIFSRLPHLKVYGYRIHNVVSLVLIDKALEFGIPLLISALCLYVFIPDFFRS